ncbi:hypothetical protein AB0I30_17610 [Nocardia tengchongensis]|uniref:AraC-like ligand-binding domain-containing protein n=1 Tax=Nocardia tengchongensis TaxID=2055889 RepID=UPI0034055C4F
MNAYDVAVGGPRFSTAGVSAKDSFGLWESILNESMMGCSLEPLTTGRFHGTLDPCVHSEPISIVQMANSGMFGRRTHRHIASSDSQDVILSLTMAGVSEMRCGEDSLRLPVGTMSILDCEQPQESVVSDYQCIVIRIRRDLLMSAAGLGEDDFPS